MQAGIAAKAGTAAYNVDQSSNFIIAGALGKTQDKL